MNTIRLQTAKKKTEHISQCYFNIHYFRLAGHPNKATSSGAKITTQNVSSTRAYAIILKNTGLVLIVWWNAQIRPVRDIPNVTDFCRNIGIKMMINRFLVRIHVFWLFWAQVILRIYDYLIVHPVEILRSTDERNDEIGSFDGMHGCGKCSCSRMLEPPQLPASIVLESNRIMTKQKSKLIDEFHYE